MFGLQFNQIKSFKAKLNDNFLTRSMLIDLMAMTLIPVATIDVRYPSTVIPNFRASVLMSQLPVYASSFLFLLV